MGAENNTKANFLLMFAVVVAASMPMGDFVIFPITTFWIDDFSGADFFVNGAISGSAIGMLIGSLLVGKITRYMSKKKILLVSSGVFTVAGFFLMAIYSIEYIFFMRIITGIAFGASMVAVYALLNDVFTDEKKRSKVIGVYNAAMGIFGIVISFVAGALATGDWHSVTYIYLVAGGLSFVLALFFIPDTGKDDYGETSEAVTGAPAANVKMPWTTIIAVCISVFVLGLCYNGSLMNVASYVQDARLGDALLAGSYSSAATAGSLVISLVFGFLYNKLKRSTSLITFVALGLGLALLWFAPSEIAGFAGFFLMGVGFGNAIAYYPMLLTEVLPASKVADGIGYFNGIQSIGSFVCTYVVAGLMGIMAAESMVAVLPVLTVCVVAGLAVSIILDIRFKGKIVKYADTIAQ